MIKDLSQLYEKKESSATPPKGDSTESASKELRQILETPPGLPQKYIETNLRDQPIPDVMDNPLEQEVETKKSSQSMTSSPTLCHVDHIPYNPGSEDRLVKERIEQGPRVFVSLAQKAEYEKSFDEKKEGGKITSKAPTLPQTNTNRAGNVSVEGSPVYRPGS